MKNERFAHLPVPPNRSQEHHFPVLHRELEGIAYELDIETETQNFTSDIQIEENKVYNISESIRNTVTTATESMRSHKVLTALGTAAAVITAGVIMDRLSQPKAPTSAPSSV